MIVDTSAVLAILFGEPDADRFAAAITSARSPRMSAASLLEVTIVLESRGGPASGHELDVLLKEAGIAVEPVTADQTQAARRARRRFGKGNHPAGLNFGDCSPMPLRRPRGIPCRSRVETSNSPIYRSPDAERGCPPKSPTMREIRDNKEEWWQRPSTGPLRSPPPVTAFVHDRSP